MRFLTCIVCPIGCGLTVDEGPKNAAGVPALTIAGNTCPKGAEYAQEEIRAPKRVVTATCALEEGPHLLRRLPVKTAVPCPQERIGELLADLYRLTLKPPIKAGDRVIPDWQGTGIPVVAARSVG